MRAIAIEAFGGPEVLKDLDVPVPQPGLGEVRIKIEAAGVNPVDWRIREGYLKDRMPFNFPIIMGWDATGRIDELGTGVTRFLRGDAVYAYCRKSEIHDGSYAEYIVVPEGNAALKPANLSFEQAAGVPLAALTARQSLFDAAQLKTGETVLVHAAAGGVGGFAVQLAKYQRATVIGTARSGNHRYLRGLGCDEVIDYSQVDFREIVHASHPEGVDVVLDSIGGDVLLRSTEVLKPGGRLVSIVAGPEIKASLAQQGIEYHYVFVAPSWKQLQELTGLFEAGDLKPVETAVLPLSEAAQAHEMSRAGHTRGKIVLRIV